MQTVAFDEAGNSGGNLLDPAQPMFALASVCVDSRASSDLVDSMLEGRQASELKFSRLARRDRGRDLLLDALDSDLLTADSVRVSIVHKRWMLAGKMVDFLIEPGIYERGLSNKFYAGGDHVRITDAFALQGPAEVGADAWRRLERAFQTASRKGDGRGIRELERTLDEAREAGRDTAVGALLTTFPSNATTLGDLLVGGSQHMDPAATTLSEQLGAWSDRLGARFRVLHDDSWAVRRSLDELLAFSRRDLEPCEFLVGDISVRLPQLADSIEFAVSEEAAEVQLADLVAGAVAFCVRDELRGCNDGFAARLRDLGIGTWIDHLLGPPGFGSTLT